MPKLIAQVHQEESDLKRHARDIMQMANSPDYETPRRVLLVDDDDSITNLVGLMLRELGYYVVGVQTGADAWEKYSMAKSEGTPFHLLILDLAMPFINGYEVAHRIRMTGDDVTRIAFLTGYPQEGSFLQRSLSFNPVAVWEKPADLSDIVRLIDELPKSVYLNDIPVDSPRIAPPPLALEPPAPEPPAEPPAEPPLESPSEAPLPEGALPEGADSQACPEAKSNPKSENPRRASPNAYFANGFKRIPLTHFGY